MPETVIKHTYQLKRGEEFTLQRLNPLLRKGEPIVVYCKDGKTNIKIGDGIHKYNDLPFLMTDTTFIKANYKVTDEESPSFIKNKPFYMEGEITTLVDNKQFSPAPTLYSYTTEEKFVELEVGQEYNIIITLKSEGQQPVEYIFNNVLCQDVYKAAYDSNEYEWPGLFLAPELLLNSGSNAIQPGIDYTITENIGFMFVNNTRFSQDNFENDNNSCLSLLGIMGYDGKPVLNKEVYVTIQKDERQYFFDESYLPLFQGDYEEGDNTKPFYIKNKPFGTEYKEIEGTLIICKENTNLYEISPGSYHMYYKGSFGLIKDEKYQLVITDKTDNSVETLEAYCTDDISDTIITENIPEGSLALVTSTVTGGTTYKIPIVVQNMDEEGNYSATKSLVYLNVFDSTVELYITGKGLTSTLKYTKQIDNKYIDIQHTYNENSESPISSKGVKRAFDKYVPNTIVTRIDVDSSDDFLNIVDSGTTPARYYHISTKNIGRLYLLTTSNKNTLIEAINEVNYNTKTLDNKINNFNFGDNIEFIFDGGNAPI